MKPRSPVRRPAPTPCLHSGATGCVYGPQKRSDMRIWSAYEWEAGPKLPEKRQFGQIHVQNVRR